MTKVTIEIPLYLKYVQLSRARKPKHYTDKDRIPKKLAHLSFMAGFLRDELGQRVVKNVRCVGTPSLKKINGQDLYNGNMSPILRSKIVVAIKESFTKYVLPVGPVQYPIRVSMELHTTMGNMIWDADNLWLYNKCFQDVLVDCGVIPDDSIMYITKAAAPEFFPVATEEERKLVFVLEPETRLIILNHPDYVRNLSRAHCAGRDHAPGTNREFIVKQRRNRASVPPVTPGKSQPKAAKLLSRSRGQNAQGSITGSRLDKTIVVPSSTPRRNNRR